MAPLKMASAKHVSTAFLVLTCFCLTISSARRVLLDDDKTPTPSVSAMSGGGHVNPDSGSGYGSGSGSGGGFGSGGGGGGFGGGSGGGSGFGFGGGSGGGGGGGGGVGGPTCGAIGYPECGTNCGFPHVPNCPQDLFPPGCGNNGFFNPCCIHGVLMDEMKKSEPIKGMGETKRRRRPEMDVEGGPAASPVPAADDMRDAADSVPRPQGDDDDVDNVNF